MADFPEMDEYRCLIWKALVEELGGADIVLSYQRPSSNHRVFPDGSLETDYSTLANAVRGLNCTVANDGFRALAGFGKHRFVLYYTEEYEKRIGERGFKVIPGDGNPESEEEHHLEDLLITIVFRRQPSKTVLCDLAALILDWNATNAPFFGGASSTLLARELVVQGRLVQFRADLRNANPDLMNWLILLVLSFGQDKSTVVGVHFDHQNGVWDGEPNYIRDYWEVSSGRKLTVPLVRTTVVEADEDRFRSYPVHPEFQSSRFRVLLGPESTWELFRILISLEEPLDTETQGELEKLLQAWFLLGEYGVYDGNPHDFLDATKTMDGKGLVATLDMGNCDEISSLNTLLRALEGFDNRGQTIEAVVLGLKKEG